MNLNKKVYFTAQILIFMIQIIIIDCKDLFNKCNTVEKVLRSASDCEFNPDEDLNVPQIIARHGYPSETHLVVTGDGYILTLHRIPGSKTGKRNGQPIFLQHGLLGSSADWIVNGNNSLGFLMADEGHDVWLGNARGNKYSKGHVSLPIYSQQFWNFSWHEMGTHDLPAVLYHVSNTTQKEGEIIYIGHSMGTTMFFVLSSVNPQAAKNVKLMVALAPVAYMTHIRSPIRYLAPFSNDIEWLMNHLGINQFLPNNKIIRFLAYDCELLNIDKKICENLIFVLCGFDKQEFNEKILPLILKNTPAGTSTKTVVHYAQEIQSGGNFQRFDYGSRGNMREYGTINPPKYNLSNIKRPIYLMYAMNDYLADNIDVKKFSNNLTNLVGLYKVSLEAFNHVDFIFGKDAEKLVYNPLKKVIANFTSF